MKTVVIWSSPNKNGLTALAKESFLLGINKPGKEFEEIHLNSEKIEHCHACGNGWGTCRSVRRCILKDDFETVYQKLIKADGIVFVSAVYWHELTLLTGSEDAKQHKMAF